MNAMLFRAQGAQVAVVGPDSKVELRSINIGRDYGTTLEVLGGVSPTDQIVINPADSLENGQQVMWRSRPEAAERQRIVKRVGNFVRSGAARSGRGMHRWAAIQPACGSQRLRPMLGKHSRPGNRPRPRMRFRRVRGGRCFTIPHSTPTSNNCCRPTSLWLPRAIILDQARSLARVATADMFPQLSADPSALRERGSANRPSEWRRSDHRQCPGLAQPITVTSPDTAYTQNVYTIPFSLSYEVDLFGRVRHNVEAANASLQSTAADLQNVQLVLTAELAADYFTLRELDAEYRSCRNPSATSARASIW